ncbi:hypothetical protein CP533_6203, partial [Ophiocordyceps camponoti-saundersi (nom. inval.)]
EEYEEEEEEDIRDPGLVYLLTNLDPDQVFQAGGIAPVYSADLPDEAYGYATFDQRGGPWILLHTAAEASRILATRGGENDNDENNLLHIYEIATGPHMVMRHPDPDRNTGFWTAAGIALSQVRRHARSDNMIRDCRRRKTLQRWGCQRRHLVYYEWDSYPESFNPRWGDYPNSGFHPWLSGYRDDHPLWRYSEVRNMIRPPPVRPSRREDFFFFMRTITDNRPGFRLMLGWRDDLPLTDSRFSHLAVSSAQEQIPQFPWEAISIPDETLRKSLSDGIQTETECALAIALIVAIWEACPARRRGRRSLSAEEDMLSLPAPGDQEQGYCTADEEASNCNASACAKLSNAVVNLKQTSSSCSAAEQRAPCSDGLSSLQVYFDRSNAVAGHEISLAFDDGPVVYRLKKSDTSLNSPGWKEVDLQSGGSRKTIFIDKVKFVSIIDSTHSGGPKTEWRGPHGFKLRGKCKSQPQPQTLLLTKYSTPKTWSQKETWSIKRSLLSQTVGTFPLTSSDWAPKKPPCTAFKRLDFNIKLSDDIGAGTYDSLSLAFGGKTATKKNVFLVESPNREFDMWKTVDLAAVFGRDTVSIEDLASVSLVDTAFENDWFSRDEWKIDHIKLKGYCSSSSKVAVVEKSSPMGEWQAHGNGWGPKPVWSRDISLDDWEESWHASTTRQGHPVPFPSSSSRFSPSRPAPFTHTSINPSINAVSDRLLVPLLEENSCQQGKD